MSWQERTLIFLLRLSGVILLLAIGAIFLPVDWMAATHRWIGLGEYPDFPLVDYLNRSISALYAIHGGLCLLVATNVRRYRAVVAYIAGAGAVFGVVMLGVDLHAGMPPGWVACEGPSVLVLSVVLLALLRAVPRE